MYTYIKERQYYEDLYDKHTVEHARWGIVHYDNFCVELDKKIQKDDKLDRPGNAIVLNAFFMQAVGEKLLHRYEERTKTIDDWMIRDSAKDDQLASARLSSEPTYQHCGKQGLRITDKSLMHRSEEYKYDDPEEVLFMLKCPHCDKVSAFWEDGVVWKPKPNLCPKCKAEMSHATKPTKKALTFTYLCPSCQYSYKDKIDNTIKEEQPDPDYEKDRDYYCLNDEKFRHHLFEIRRGFEEFARLGKELQEKADNKHIYDAVKEMKKPKIAELIPLLSEPLEKAGYIEFHLDKPEMGRDVYVGFSCLDSKSDRDDYDSRKTLKKLVDKTLLDTNWRLMSDGISYRLGYLNGRVKAYEGEEALKALVVKDRKLTPKPQTDKRDGDTQTMEGPNGEKIIL